MVLSTMQVLTPFFAGFIPALVFVGKILKESVWDLRDEEERPFEEVGDKKLLWRRMQALDLRRLALLPFVVGMITFCGYWLIYTLIGVVA